ncbi:MAG: hypothetical protein PVJ02_05725 [Gemmatimonadota bacterium]
MKVLSRIVLAVVTLVGTACGTGAQEASRPLVVSSDRQLAELASALLPDLAHRAGMELKEPVRLEKRSREQLVRYLRNKLDQELPEGEARAEVSSYHLLGLVPDSLDLRGVLLSLYTEQVAGFYEPDSTALFIMDDQPASAVQGLLIHELVHAVQDQTVDLHALTDPSLSEDRRNAAQAAIEGQATLVMLEYLTEQMRGAPVDLADVPDFAASLRPALEGVKNQFPARASAPEVIQESLLFPYVEGAGYVQSLWTSGKHTPPFGPYLPMSTEQVVTHDRNDAPVILSVSVDAGRVARSDNLGRLETGVLLDTRLGDGGADLAEGWGGDEYALVDLPDGSQGLAWATVWDDVAARDRFVAALTDHLDGFPLDASLEPLDVDGRPGALLRVGLPSTVTVRVRRAS